MQVWDKLWNAEFQEAREMLTSNPWSGFPPTDVPVQIVMLGQGIQGVVSMCRHNCVMIFFVLLGKQYWGIACARNPFSGYVSAVYSQPSISFLHCMLDYGEREGARYSIIKSDENVGLAVFGPDCVPDTFFVMGLPSLFSPCSPLL